MPTATATPSASRPRTPAAGATTKKPLLDAATVAIRAAEATAKAERETEDLLIRTARGEDVSPESLATALAQVPWGRDNQDVKRRTGQAASIAQLQVDCGTPAELDAANEALQSAHREAERVQAEIDQTLNRLQPALQAANIKVRDAQEIVNAHQGARNSLRRRADMTDYVQMLANSAERSIQPLLTQIEERKVRLTSIDSLLKIDRDLNVTEADYPYEQSEFEGVRGQRDQAAIDRNNFVHATRRAAEDQIIQLAMVEHHPALKGLNMNNREQASSYWRKYITPIRAERVAVEAELRRLESSEELKRCREIVNSVRDYYLPR